MVNLLAVALMASAALASSGFLSQWQGGKATSPDGRWSVASQQLEPDSETSAVATLSGPEVSTRALMRFERSAEIRWNLKNAKVLIIERWIHKARVVMFSLGVRDTADPTALQGSIEYQMARLYPRLGTIENRLLIFGSAIASDCVAVEESGLPPGRAEGSYIVRRAAFRLDLARNRAVRVASCPGVRLE